MHHCPCLFVAGVMAAIQLPVTAVRAAGCDAACRATADVLCDTDVDNASFEVRGQAIVPTSPTYSPVAAARTTARQP